VTIFSTIHFQSIEDIDKKMAELLKSRRLKFSTMLCCVGGKVLLSQKHSTSQKTWNFSIHHCESLKSSTTKNQSHWMISGIAFRPAKLVQSSKYLLKKIAWKWQKSRTRYSFIQHWIINCLWYEETEEPITIVYGIQ
jgi:hypothetical protein